MQMCTIDDGQYIMCNFDDQIFNAALIDHLPIKIKSKYIFACSPIGRNNSFVSTRLVNFAKAYSVNESVTIEFLKHNLKWSSLGVPENIDSIVHLENVYDVLDLYLWLGFRFPAIFSYTEQVKEMRVELEFFIEKGVEKLLANKRNNNSLRKVSKPRHSSLKSVEKPEAQSSKTPINTNLSFENKLVNSKVDDFAKFDKQSKELSKHETSTEHKYSTQNSVKNLDNANEIQAMGVKVNTDGEMKSDDTRFPKDRPSTKDIDSKQIHRKNSEASQNIFSRNEMHALKANLEREEAKVVTKRNVFEEDEMNEVESMFKFNKLLQAKRFTKKESSTEEKYSTQNSAKNLDNMNEIQAIDIEDVKEKNVFSKIDMHDLKDMSENPEEIIALSKRSILVTKGDDTNIFEEDVTSKSSVKKESMFKYNKLVQTKDLARQGTSTEGKYSLPNFAKNLDNTKKIQVKDMKDLKEILDGEMKSDEIRRNVSKDNSSTEDKYSKRIQTDNFVTKQNIFSKIDLHDLKDLKGNLETEEVNVATNSITKREDTNLAKEDEVYKSSAKEEEIFKDLSGKTKVDSGPKNGNNV